MFILKTNIFYYLVKNSHHFDIRLLKFRALNLRTFFPLISVVDSLWSSAASTFILIFAPLHKPDNVLSECLNLFS